MPARCETRSDLVFAVGAVMATREGEPPDLVDLAFVAFFYAGYLLPIALGRGADPRVAGGGRRYAESLKLPRTGC
jgi:hypothetical protein